MSKAIQEQIAKYKQAIVELENKAIKDSKEWARMLVPNWSDLECLAIAEELEGLGYVVITDQRKLK